MRTFPDQNVTRMRITMDKSMLENHISENTDKFSGNGLGLEACLF